MRSSFFKKSALGDIAFPLSSSDYDPYSGELIVSSYDESAVPDVQIEYQSEAETQRLLAYEQAATELAQEPPAQVIAPTADTSWSFEQIVKGIGTVAREMQAYRKNELPTGGAVYTRIDPRTGQPVQYGQTLTMKSGGIADMLKSTPVLIGAGLLALYYLAGQK